MIDTVRLVLPFNERPEWFGGVDKTMKKDANTGGVATTINPGKSYKMAGIYLPRLKYREQPTRDGIKRTLGIELSLPKLMFGNNLDELSDADFDAVTVKLSDALRTVYDVWLSPEELAMAEVRKIDYSKNIIFADYTPVSTIISTIRTADVPKTYDVQKDTFKNGGHAYHIHTNSLDVIVYDKVADLKQSRVSSKRTLDKDGYIQPGLLDLLETKKSLTVPRFEVRLNSVRKIRAEQKEVGFIGGITFRELYSTDLSCKILLKHWNTIFTRIPKAEAIAGTAENMLIALKQTNPDMKFSEACRTVLFSLIRKGAADERYVRNLIDGLFGSHTYNRYKHNGREPPNLTQLKTLLKITETLTAMKPVSIDDYC